VIPIYRMAEFNVPAETSKVLAVPTQKAYTRYLNKIASAGFDTPEALLKRPFAVTSLIKKMSPGDDDTARNRRRFFISAVFWVLPESYRKRPNPYQMLNITSLPTHGTDGTAWEPNAKLYLKKQKS